MISEYDRLVGMADMYANVCTRQHEKYMEQVRCYGYVERWEDCEAAYDLLRELPNYWELMDFWRKENKCKFCGQLNTQHLSTCKLGGYNASW